MGKIIIQFILGKGWEGVDWNHLAEDRDYWQAVMNLRVP
jgi:hypothetical protein